MEPTAPPSPSVDVLDETHCFESDLDRHVRKAEAWTRHAADELLHQDRCHHCNGVMWTWSDKEDICERCGYEIRMERQLQQRKLDKNRAPISFGEGNSTGRVPVNVDGGAAQRQVNPYAPIVEKNARINPLSEVATVRKGANPFGK